MNTSSTKHTLDQKKSVILFDFDGTLFDTTQLKQSVAHDLKKYTTDVDLLWQIEKKLRDRRYHLVETMKMFCEAIGKTDIHDTIQRIFLEQPFPSFVFADTITTVQALRGKNIIALFTQGDETYQQIKIQLSHISQYIDFQYIFQHKLAHLLEVSELFPNRDIWYVDNHIGMLKDAVSILPSIKTVWINRENLHNSTGYTPTQEIQMLSQLPEYLSQT